MSWWSAKQLLWIYALSIRSSMNYTTLMNESNWSSTLIVNWSFSHEGLVLEAISSHQRKFKNLFQSESMNSSFGRHDYLMAKLASGSFISYQKQNNFFLNQQFQTHTCLNRAINRAVDNFIINSKKFHYDDQYKTGIYITLKANYFITRTMNILRESALLWLIELLNLKSFCHFVA
jgi:hypothetical protein